MTDPRPVPRWKVWWGIFLVVACFITLSAVLIHLYGVYYSIATRTADWITVEGTVDRVEVYKQKGRGRRSGYYYATLLYVERADGEEPGLFLVGHDKYISQAENSHYRDYLGRKVTVQYRESEEAQFSRHVDEQARLGLPHRPYHADAVCVSEQDRQRCDPTIEQQERRTHNQLVLLSILWAVLVVCSGVIVWEKRRKKGRA